MIGPPVIILDMSQACDEFADAVWKEFSSSSAEIHAKLAEIFEYAFYSHITALGMRHRIEIRQKVLGSKDIEGNDSRGMIFRVYCNRVLAALAHKLAEHDLEEVTTHDYYFYRLESNGIVVIRRKS